ncbi:MAG: rhodanese-like domain-containing protein [Sinobacteraceae bacterium]|nr:rhodanese-like domain-containing protein [Nevskiaceae bacterium]
MKPTSWLLLFGLSVATTAARAAGVPGPVVSAAWLHDHLAEVTVVDVRDEPETFTVAPTYETDPKTGARALTKVGGHIPGARLVEFGKIRVDREINGKMIKAMLPDRGYFENLMRAAGVSGSKPIVITMPGETLDQVDMATRLYWSLKYYGTDELAILDGGNAAWLAAGYEVSTDPPAAGGGDWSATAERKSLLAESADVSAAQKSKKVQLVDARPLPQYLGLSKKPVVLAAGHIPGAKNLPTDVVTRAAGPAQHFLSAADYRGVLNALGIKPSASTITYCNTGHLASGAWFVMSEILGNPHVKLYDGSMTEWTTEKQPVVAAIE